MGRGYEETVLQRRNSDGQQTHEKMLHITNYQKNANKKHNEIITSHQLGWPASKRLRTNAGEDEEKGEPSYTAGGNVNQSNQCGKQYGGSSKKLKMKDGFIQ